MGARESRDEQIRTGQLLDVSRIAYARHEFRVSTAIAIEAWLACGGTSGIAGTALGDVLADQVLGAARAQAMASSAATMRRPELPFAVERVDGRIVELLLKVGPDERGEPAATLLLDPHA